VIHNPSIYPSLCLVPVSNGLLASRNVGNDKA
jgi:hypothetical protein